MELNNSLLSRIVKSLIKYPILVIAIVILFVAAAIPGLSYLNISVNMEDFFVADDPILENQKEFRRLFQNNDFIGVLVENDDVFSRESLELIKETGLKLEESISLAGTVLSITELENLPLGGKSFAFDGNKLLSDDEEIEEIRNSYREIPSINNTLFSKDFKQAWILVQLDPYPVVSEGVKGEDPAFSIGKSAYDTVQSIDSGHTVLTATGVPVYAYRKEAEMMEDLFKVLAIGALTALVLSILIIQSVQGVTGAILVIFLSVLSVFGIMGWSGSTIDSAFISVPILLTMGVSIGYTVHISRFFTLYFQKTGKRHEAVLYAIQESGRPIIFTAFTTIVALISFAFVEIRPIQWVGISSASCILAVCLLTLFFFPLLLSLGKDKKIDQRKSLKKARFEPVLNRFSIWIVKYEKMIIILFILSLVFALFGILRLEIDFNAEKMMGTRLQHMKDQMHIGQSEIATSDNMDLVLKLPLESLKTREILLALDELEKSIQKMPLVKKTTSLNRLIREFNFLKNKREPESNRIPEKQSTVRGLLLFYERLTPETLRAWVDEEYSTTRIFIELSDFSSKEIAQVISLIEKQVKTLFPSDTEFFMSGSTFQMAVMNQYITTGLVRSVLTALIMITLLMIIVFKSIKLGLIAMIPNVYPILIVGAIMGYSGIPLEFVTMTVAPMIMGLAVDDTIHLISHIKKDLLKTGDCDVSIKCTFSTVGTAITETTVILCLSFLVFTVSDVNSIRNMGILSCCGMFTAYLADIFVTPILIRQFHPVAPVISNTL